MAYNESWKRRILDCFEGFIDMICYHSGWDEFWFWHYEKKRMKELELKEKEKEERLEKLFPVGKTYFELLPDEVVIKILGYYPSANTYDKRLIKAIPYLEKFIKDPILLKKRKEIPYYIYNVIPIDSISFLVAWGAAETEEQKQQVRENRIMKIKIN